MDYKEEQISSIKFDGELLTIYLNYASLAMLRYIAIIIGGGKTEERIELGKPIKKSYEKVIVKCTEKKYLKLVEYLYNSNYIVKLDEKINEKEYFQKLDEISKIQMCVHRDEVRIKTDSMYDIGCNKIVKKIDYDCKCNNKIEIYGFKNYNGDDKETFYNFFTSSITFSLMEEPPIILNCGHYLTPNTLAKLEKDDCPTCREPITTTYALELIQKCFSDYNEYLLQKTIKYNNNKRTVIKEEKINSITFDELHSEDIFNFNAKDIIPRMIHEFRKKIIKRLNNCETENTIFGGILLREIMKNYDKDYNIPSDVDIDIKVKNKEDYISIIEYLRKFYKCPKIRKIRNYSMKGYRHKICQKENIFLDDEIICVYIDITINNHQSVDFDVNSLQISSNVLSSNNNNNLFEKSILFDGSNNFDIDIIKNIKDKKTNFLFHFEERKEVLQFKINKRYPKIFNKGFSVNNIFIVIEDDKFKLNCGCVVDNIDNISLYNFVMKTFCEKCDCFNIVAVESEKLLKFLN